MHRLHPARPARATALLVLALIALAPPAAARAGTYTVYSCQGPTGAPAPTDGWRAITESTRGYVYAADGCAAGGAMRAWLEPLLAHPSNAASAGWEFGAPQGTSLLGYRIWRSGIQDDALGTTGSSMVLATYRPRRVYDGANVVDNCRSYTGCRQLGDPFAGRVAANLLAEDLSAIGGAPYWAITAGCGGSAGASCAAAGGTLGRVEVSAAELRLRDATAPEVTHVTGQATEDSVWSGREALAFNAADSGGGVYRTLLRVDGEPVPGASQIVDEADGWCRPAAGTSDPHAFLHAVPCPGATSGATAIDATTLPYGRHVVELLVEDAAGNTARVYGPAVKTIAGGPPPPVPAATPSQPPAVAPAATPAQAAAPAAAQRLLACAADGLVLTDVYPSGGRAVIRGIARRADAGRRVAIVSLASGRIVARPLVNPDGAFGAVVGAPRGRAARSDRARYVARIGPRRSRALKLHRKMDAREVHASAAGSVRISGVVHAPVAGGIIRVAVQTSCRTWRTVTSTGLDDGGRFHATVHVGGPASSAVVRASARIRSRGRVRTTYTLPAAVALR